MQTQAKWIQLNANANVNVDAGVYVVALVDTSYFTFCHPSIFSFNEHTGTLVGSCGY